MSRPIPVHEWDQFVLPGGFVFSAVGTFGADRIRGRLAYVPDPSGPVTIAGTRCRKINHDVWGTIPGTEQRLISLPGENHYLVHTDQVARWFPAIDPVGMPLPAGAAILHNALTAVGAVVRLGGSRALGCETLTSDFDWVAHLDPTADLAPVAAAVRALPEARVSIPGGMGRMRAKYSHFRQLRDADLFTLIRDRWRHILVDGVQMSVDVADPNHLADAWLHPVRRQKRDRVHGVLTDASACYRTPKILTLDGDQPVRVVTWFNLYTGALCDGDTIEATGTWITRAGHRYLLVDTSKDAIRVLDRRPTHAHAR